MNEILNEVEATLQDQLSGTKTTDTMAANLCERTCSAAQYHSLSQSRPSSGQRRNELSCIMNQPPLWQWTASDIAMATRCGSISASDVTETAMARIDAGNPALNAVIESLTDKARAEAAALDANEKPKETVNGVPFAVKINVNQKGHATNNSVTALKNIIAPLVRHQQAELRDYSCP